MKKFFTMAAIAMAAFTANATDYTDELTVTLNGTPISTSESTISVDQNDNGTYLLQLRNFILSAGGSTLPIGNIIVDNVQGFESSDGSTVLTTSQVIAITGGAMDDMLSSVPVDIRGEIREGKLFAIIDIDMMATLEQAINVQFGDGGYQIGNSGFEEFHTATYVNGENSYSSDEPNAWHSFNSGKNGATGEWASLVGMALQYGSTSQSDETRPGSTGTKSVVIKSAFVLITPANGTMTTGRMQAGDATPTNPANCAFMDMSLTDVDGNGDPFYTVLNGMPDSLAVWVKYKQAQENAEYPYATVSAVITDGTYYQDPEDKEYTNVLAKAQNKEIASNGFTWQRLSIPFDYATYSANNVEGKALLVTISTNAQPGVGSSDPTNPDSLLVDDIELIYNGEVTGISIKGQAIEEFDPATAEYTVAIDGDDADVTADDITVATNAQGAKVFMDFADAAEAESGNDVTITVMSADLKTSSTYLVKTRSKGFLDGIENVAADSSEVEAIYNLSGQRVENPVKGQVYITKYTDGKTVKTIMK